MRVMVHMKQERNIIQIGGSLGITLDRKWLRFYEKKHGQAIHSFIVDYSDDVLIVTPVREILGGNERRESALTVSAETKNWVTPNANNLR
jgi:hypothetical protein